MRNTLLKPILSLSVLMGASGCFTQGYAEDIVIVDGLWKISYIENDHAFRVNVLNEDGSARKCLFTRSASEVAYDNLAGESRTVTPASFADIKQTKLLPIWRSSNGHGLPHRLLSPPWFLH